MTPKDPIVTAQTPHLQNDLIAAIINRITLSTRRRLGLGTSIAWFLQFVLENGS